MRESGAFTGLGHAEHPFRVYSDFTSFSANLLVLNRYLDYLAIVSILMLDYSCRVVFGGAKHEDGIDYSYAMGYR